MRTVRFILVLAIALAFAGVVRAEEPDLVVSTGAKRGSYHGIGERLETHLRLENSVDVRVLESAGSMENLARLADPGSPVGVGLAQADALHQYLERNPDFQEKLLVLGDLGRECAFVVAGSNGAIETIADFQKEGGTQISLVDENSGAAVTWANLARLEPALANTEVVYVDVMEALLTIKEDAGLTPLEAVMLVQRPLRRSRPLEVAFKDPQAYRFVPIDGVKVSNATLPDGTEVYTFDEVAIGGKDRRGATKVETLCTRGLMLGNKDKLSKERRGQLATAMLEQGSGIIGEDE